MTRNGIRLSVCLSFDFDGLSNWIGSLKTTNPCALSRGEFCAVGVPRILELLRRREIQATFFVPGHTALAYPDLVCRIRDDGHEIGHHGWVHENPADLEPGVERENFEKALQALEEIAGVRPRGYRSPAAEFSASTLEILLENKIVYDSSFSASDFSPYYLREGDRQSSTDPYVFGSLADMVEIPFAWHLDDFPHFEFVPGFSTAQSTPSAVREIWQAEFDYAHTHCVGGVYDLCMHPQVIGRGSRLNMLEGLLDYMSEKDGVVFEPMLDYAERWKAANPIERLRADDPRYVRDLTQYES